MNIYYWDACALIGPGSKWIAGILDKVGSSYVVSNVDGTVLSIQPDGSQQSRPKGTAGPYEVCTPSTTINVLTYNPAGIPFQLAYKGR